MTKITPSDLALFNKAQQVKAQALAQEAFVSQHLTETYQLTQEDRVDLTTGEITRAAEAPTDMPDNKVARVTRKKKADAPVPE